MKSTTICLLLTFLCFFTFAQTPLGFNFQGIARDNFGRELSNKNISLKLSILLNTAKGTAIYSESHAITTNSLGLFNVKVGTGDVIVGDFININWSACPYFLKVEMDPAGGTNYVLSGSSQLLPVPYAYMANLAFKSLNDLDTSSYNELQTMRLSNDTLYLDKGGLVYLGGYNDKNEIQEIKNSLNANGAYYGIIINDEVTERKNDDYKLSQKIFSDSNYLKGLINSNISNINKETNSRISGQQSLLTKQIADSSYLRAMLNTLYTNLSYETSKRSSSDNDLKTKQISDSIYLKGLIATETINRTNSDNLIHTNINTIRVKEVSDSLLFADFITTTINSLNTETITRISACNSIRSKMSYDSFSMRTIVNNATSNLTNETNSRITGDNNLKIKIVSDSTFLKGLITTCATNSSNDDNTLQTNISTESNSRIIGDNSIRSKISSDSSTLRTAISTTNSNLTNETNSRITNYNNLKTKIVSDSAYLKGQVNIESTYRSSTDNTLQTNLTNETYSRTSGDNNIRNKISNDSVSLRTILNNTSTNLANEANFRISGDQSLKSKLVSDSSYLKGLINNKQGTLIAGAGITINSSNSIKAADSSSTNELQTLSIRNDSIFLSNGGYVKLPAYHYVGELYGGGVIFFVDQTGMHGLICSMTDLSSSQEWSNVNYAQIGVEAQSDWNGQSNTNIIIGQSGHSNSAAKLCDDYTNANYGTGIFSDWYLPAMDQCYLLYQTKYQVNKTLDGDGNASTTSILKSNYWSSTEFDATISWMFEFITGIPKNIYKNSSARIRAIRTF
jgi:hypothetical protein